MVDGPCPARPAELRIRLRPREGSPLRAELVLDRADGIALVPASTAAAIETAIVNTVGQPLRWLSTTVVEGVDAGSRLTVISGGPCTSGLAAVLARVPRSRVPLPALVTVVSDRVLVVGHVASTGTAETWSALADRMARYQMTVSPPPRPVLWCRADGRLTIFEAEDS